MIMGITGSVLLIIFEVSATAMDTAMGTGTWACGIKEIGGTGL